MIIAQTAKEELLLEIEHLSNPCLDELQRFIRYLRLKQSGKAIFSDEKSVLPPEHDPILHEMGMFEAAPFSDAIDDTLYGTL